MSAQLRRGPAVGAASVITNDIGQVLLVRHGYGERNWELPGGGGEPGESAEETAIREAREEVGASLRIERLTGVYWEPDFVDGAGAHHFVFKARLSGTSPAPRVTDAKEITACGWFDPSALPSPMSDFTERRIADAFVAASAQVYVVGPRRWRR